jgi:hypothetical protein
MIYVRDKHLQILKMLPGLRGTEMILGHSISTADGVIQSIDESVATILQRNQKQLVGISYTSITHPDDLARNLTHVAALQPNGSSLRIRKRYIGGEGSIIMLEVQVSRIGSRDNGHLVGTLSTVPCAAASTDHFSASGTSPHRLWRRAKDLLEVMQSRDAILGADLFADHAWASLLIIYVAEAESRIATVGSIVAQLNISRSTLMRWLRVLQSKSLIDHIDMDLDAVQLTQTGIARIERLLTTKALTPID